MNVRLFDPTDTEYDAIVAVHNAACPTQPVDVALMRQADARRKPKFFFERYVAEMDGQVVAMGTIGHTPWSYRPKKFIIDWVCHPDWEESADIAFFTDLYERLLTRSPEKVLAYIREDQLRRIHHLTKLGFEQSLVDAYSALMVGDFNFDAYGDLPAYLESQGVRIVTMSELEQSSDDGWVVRLESAEWEILQDVPQEEAFTRGTVAEWMEGNNDPRRPHDGYFIAVNNEGEFVGVSYLKRGAENVFYTGFTGVKRNWRRKGVATALKVRAIEYAHRMGVHTIQTDNEENNPMYALNMQLGFKPLPSWSDYIKVFS
ncbi:MAG: GNAT family N-acetyltransferase [Candidatus Promineifilaceae bacterium]